MKGKWLAIVAIILANTVNGQSGFSFWTDIEAGQILLPRGAEMAIPARHYRMLELDAGRAGVFLQRAPQEGKTGSLVFHIPLPDGTTEACLIHESPLMPAALTAKYPEIRTYLARSLQHPAWNGRIDFTPQGFHAALRTGQGLVYIDPVVQGSNRYYASYYTRDLQWPDALNMPRCGVSDEEIQLQKDLLPPIETPVFSLRSGGAQETVELRTYRLALSCTGEYGQAKGGNKTAVLASMVTAINRVNQILEAETAVRLQLIPNNDTLIFLNGETDPFISPNNAPSLLSQNTTVLNQIIGAPAYDIGHVFTMSCVNSIGGIARYASACGPQKGAGVTCHFTSSVEFIAVQIMAHELGHQFSCAHTWNRCSDFPDQYDLDDAFEPGSGSTIMSYAGGCSNQNIQQSSDDYYHVGSLEDFISFSRKFQGNSCATIVPTSNRAPEITLPYPANFSIPINTPFELRATATDPDGDALTYCWEQYDTGPSMPLGEALFSSPLFRSFPPNANPARTFPRLSAVINGENPPAELLPSYARKLTFRCTVRDNFPGAGGVSWAQVQFNATDKAGPFRVTSPNTSAVNWAAGSTQTVSWDVANTHLDPVNCRYVNIRLSVDGGFTYPYLLAENAFNNGAAQVSIPNVATTQARIRVEAADNIFFDISNQNFSIAAPVQPGYALTVRPYNVPLHCQPKILQFAIASEQLLGFDSPIQFQLLGQLPSGSTHSFSLNPAPPGSVIMLNIQLANAPRDTVELTLRASAANGPTIERKIGFITLSNDFSALTLQQPQNGAAGIVLSTPFNWSNSPNALRYNFELATNPQFGDSTIARQNGISGTSFQPATLLPDNKLYFWRIQPENECGPGAFLDPFTFHTATTSCNTFQSANVPLNIPGTGTPTIESRITVTAQGTISDVNIPQLRINKEYVRNLQVSLISPKGTEVQLYNGHCALTSRLFIGFDDEAPQAVNGTGVCPPDKSIVFRPVQPLSAFKGENTEGVWTLRVRILRNESLTSGALESWSLEFCSTQIPSNPALVRNEPLRVPPGRSNTIRNVELLAEDAGATAAQLRYTLVKAPERGVLELSGATLKTGDRFTQEMINNFNLRYTHRTDTHTTDFFTFVLENSKGGFLPTRRFNIIIDQGAVVGVKEIPGPEGGLKLFPNPAKDAVTMEWEAPLKNRAWVGLFNVQGQRILTQAIDPGARQLLLPTSMLPEGLYLLRIDAQEARPLSGKLLIQR